MKDRVWRLHITDGYGKLLEPVVVRAARFSHKRRRPSEMIVFRDGWWRRRHAFQGYIVRAVVEITDEQPVGDQVAPE